MAPTRLGWPLAAAVRRRTSSAFVTPPEAMTGNQARRAARGRQCALRRCRGACRRWQYSCKSRRRFRGPHIGGPGRSRASCDTSSQPSVATIESRASIPSAICFAGIAYHRAEPVGLLERLRPDDHPLDADRFEQQADRRLIPQAATDLAGNADGLDDGADHFVVHRFAGSRSVEIDQVQPRRSLGRPAPSDEDRVLAEDRFPACSHPAASARICRRGGRWRE